MYWHYIIILIVLIIISFIVIKMNKKDFNIKINKLIEYLGGKDNILDVESNLSRLKVTVRDVVEIDNQLKIIYGPNAKQLKKYIKDLK